MTVYDIITKKKHGEVLTKEEIDFVVAGFTNGSIPDYQMSALLMAICLKGMNAQETVNLTMAMAKSGDMLDLSPIKGVKVDKHSTGGVGDKTSLCVGPIVASLGVSVAKMSGRGLGHTGGTIDKLESIPGYCVEISNEEFFDIVNTHGISIIGQSADLAPADKKMYALRDVTATVDNLSLIASSIMSKKLAAGADAIVLDVKTGSGAFMKSLEDSIALAKQMVAIGTMSGKKTYALITDMNQPLGEYVGNSLEVWEAVRTLLGNGPEDFTKEVVLLSEFMLLAAGKAADLTEAEGMVKDAVSSGNAIAKLREFVTAQHGDASVLTEDYKFEKAALVLPVYAKKDGFIEAVNTEEIGLCSTALGGGREKKEDVIDHAVGLRICRKIGDRTDHEPIAVIYANDADKANAVSERLKNAYTIGEKPVSRPKTVYGYVDSDGFHEI